MADRKATNKYYPPDWDPSKGSINAFVGQHPLRDRAKKLDQGILIVRFELPYNIWCNGCNNPIGMGYQNAAYVVTAGARKKVEEFEAEDNETLEIDTPEEFERRANDQFAKLEHVQRDALKAQSGATVLTRLQQLNDRQWSDPYALSQRLRKEFRTAKKARLKEEADCKSVADRVGFSFGILPESEEDRQGSKAIEFESGKKALAEQRLKEVKSGSLFSKSAARTTAKGGLLVKPRNVLKSSSSPPSLGSDNVVSALASTVNTNTRLQLDPFLVRSKPKVSPVLTAKSTPAPKAPLVSYGADDDQSDDEGCQ
ncbi:hypothetical protein BGZ65_002345 [Modicella reniformis]|uniref:Coiled-coil domain-containing protein 130 n=1 Tax=Modicella reniformis TaxID=1440133 RepID=A0A9P6MI65_9FUNG|nr:hypothetical protein BGZ65_002345 [Modicella reniformis]